MPASRLNHTMLRVKDIDKSLDFYTRILGMELLDKSAGSDFCNYFLAFPVDGENLTAEEKAKTKTAREGVLELCHNFGTENDADFHYVNGNEEPHRGFGHIAVSVDDVQASRLESIEASLHMADSWFARRSQKETDRLTELGVQFKKRPEEGKMRHIAFIYDPDRYWIELVPNKF